MNFEYFQIQKCMLQIVRTGTVYEKYGVICLVSIFAFWVMVLKLSQKVYIFLQCCSALSKKSRFMKTVYIFASEVSLYGLSENGIVYYAMDYCFGNTRVWSWRILLSFCWISIFFDILVANVLWLVTQTTLSHNIFWKSVVRTFRCIYLNCFNRLRFLVEVSTKLQKIHFFGQFKNHNVRKKHGN